MTAVSQSALNHRQRTVPASFLDAVHRQSNAPALRWREGEGFGCWTWREYASRAASAAAGLQQLGVKRQDRVILLTRNRPEFHVADMGALLAGATPVSIY